MVKRVVIGKHGREIVENGKPSRQRIVDGMAEALGHAKGIMDGHKITIYSATEFFIGGIRYPAGRYEMVRVGDAPSSNEIIF